MEYVIGRSDLRTSYQIRTLEARLNQYHLGISTTAIQSTIPFILTVIHLSMYGAECGERGSGEAGLGNG